MSENVSNEAGIQFIGRVSKIPIISSALFLAGESYGRIKGYNELVGSTLSRAEQSIQYVAETAKPMVRTFERQLLVADSFACQGLDKLEEVVPVIKQSPQELYGGLKKYGNDKVQGLKDYGYNKVNDAITTTYAQAVLKSVDSAIDLTEQTLDHYLPPTEEEAQNTEPAQNVIQRMGSLSDKMRRRMYKQAVGQVQHIQKRSQDALEQMRFSVDLIQYAKSIEEVGRKKVADGVSVVQQRAKWLWDELNKEEPQDSEQGSKTLEGQVLAVARRAARQVTHRYKELTALPNMLPVKLRNAIEESATYTKDFYTHLSTTSNLKDIPAVALQEFATGIRLMQKLLADAIIPVSSEQPKP